MMGNRNRYVPTLGLLCSTGLTGLTIKGDRDIHTNATGAGGACGGGLKRGCWAGSY